MKLSIYSCVVPLLVLTVFAGQAVAQSSEVVLHAHTGQTAGNWSVVNDTTAAGGRRLANADRGVGKLDTARATPADYFELDFTAPAGVAYRLWIRGRAEGNAWSNDSVFVQFSDSVAASGSARHRIGSTEAMIYSIEDCNGCGIAGWGWNDDVYGPEPGEQIRFAAGGRHTVRIQAREDGISIDQIVLSPSRYASASPGQGKNDSVVLAAMGGVSSAADVVLHPATATTLRNWTRVTDSTAAGGARLASTDRGVPKLSDALASPSDYFELQFPASAGVGYRLWMRGKADGDSYGNDSVFAQFSDSVTASGAASYRIGTTASTVVSIEDCSGCGLSGWGWNDNFYGEEPGELIYFAASGTHTIRVQTREDGLSLDQIVLSPARYLTQAPGNGKSDSVILASTVGTGGGGSGTGSGSGSEGSSGGTGSGNRAPVFEADPDGFRIAARSGSTAAPATILLTASATGPESSDSLTYTWNFGDGSPAVTTTPSSSEPSRQNVMHTYSRAGTFTARVTVTDQAGNTATRTGTVTLTAPAVSGSGQLKVFQLNTYKGRTTDTRTEQSRTWLQARWMAASEADVVVLQEVMGSNHAAKYKAELEKAMPGTTWSYFFRSDAAANSTTAQGLAILSRLPIVSTAATAYAPCPSIEIVQRAAIAVTVQVSGRNVAVIGTHLSSYGGTDETACRLRQAQHLESWAGNLAPIRIITGDLNAQPTESAMRHLTSNGYLDMWTQGASAGRAISYPDNPVSSLRTRTGRIDYVLLSRDAPVDLVAVQVPDTRDYTNDTPIASQGQTNFAPQNEAPRAADHELIIATFRVR